MRGASEIHFDEDEYGNIVECSTYISLVRLLGYVKYHSSSTVLVRGQSRCWGNLNPSAIRTAPNNSDLHREADDFLVTFRNTLQVDLEEAQQHSTEPHLQHYGIRTRWLDVVDSLPHALYFAVFNQYNSDGRSRMILPQGGESSTDYGYLYLIDCDPDEARAPQTRGVWTTDSGLKICDLRRAKPSKALRPHSQHGYLIRGTDTELNLWNRVLVRIRVPRKQAHEWISGHCLAHCAMFPGEHEDQNYATLLDGRVSTAITEWKSRCIRAYDPGTILRYSTD